MFWRWIIFSLIKIKAHFTLNFEYFFDRQNFNLITQKGKGSKPLNLYNGIARKALRQSDLILNCGPNLNQSGNLNLRKWFHWTLVDFVNSSRILEPSRTRCVKKLKNKIYCTTTTTTFQLGSTTFEHKTDIDRTTLIMRILNNVRMKWQIVNQMKPSTSISDRGCCCHLLFNLY